MRIFQVMPRRMYFGESLATSIDLCVHDLVAASRFQSNTTVLAAEVEDPFPGIAIDHLPEAHRAATFARANHVARRARDEKPDLIVVQQHLPTAAAIARRLPWAKVVFHTHNFRKPCPVDGSLKNRVRRAVHKHCYGVLSGIIHVSAACAHAFERDWPDTFLPKQVVTNGLDFSAWHPRALRDKEILCVARCVPEKGVLEAAQALASVLPEAPDWRARFVLSGADGQAAFFRKVREALAPLGAQACVEVQLPWERVKQANEKAAIALVPSIWAEPFGRTALEAHAGGAALISSGTGGLSEGSGECALMLPEVSPGAIAAALNTLMADQHLRERLARAGAERACQRFDIHRQAARMDEFFSQSVSCRRPISETEIRRGSRKPRVRQVTQRYLKRSGRQHENVADR